jgi:phospholipase C
MDRRKFLQVGAASAATAVVGCGGLAATPGPRAPRTLGGKIEHLIVLMMENRSYDQMLGALSGPEHDGVIEPTGLPYDDSDGWRRSVSLRYGTPPDQFYPDPPHNFSAVAAQIHGLGADGPADMGGFARRFVEDHPSVGPRQIRDYATLYADGRLPILQGLAREYGVCSHWFCSVPSSTTPNRMFVHAGTSRGVTRQGIYHSRIRGRTIFDKLGGDPSSWGVYYHDVPHLWLIGDGWSKAFGRNHHHMGAFARHVREDRLPTYSFLEPQHVVPPWSSQHPAAGVSNGEKLIAHVYNTLVGNPLVFAKSLLLIVYDEHGGFYDHVIPPGHPGWNDRYPDLQHTVLPPDEAVDLAAGREKRRYDFTTLGPRVPAVVVSPWIERGSVFGWKAMDPARRATFDHTSILATVGRMTGAWVDSARARAATTLEVTLNRTTARAPGEYPPRLDYEARAYRRDRSSDRIAAQGLEQDGSVGVAAELRDAWRGRHGDATALEMAERFRELVGNG